MHGNRTEDRRVRRTKKHLQEALDSLIREKPYDEIVVQEILDRADVGRSTFYMHFRDKDELLASGIRNMLGSMPAPPEVPSAGKRPEQLLGFSLPTLEHIHRHLRVGAARMGARGRAVVHEHLRRVVAARIADDVRRIAPGRRRPAGSVPPDLLVPFVAATFILVLNWWVESRSPLPPSDVDALSCS